MAWYALFQGPQARVHPSKAAVDEGEAQCRAGEYVSHYDRTQIMPKSNVLRGALPVFTGSW